MIRSLLWFGALCSVLLSASRAVEPSVPMPPSASLVQVREGALSGLRQDPGVTAYLGIPYARPPVGELRWREPQPALPWQGVREAVRFGPRPLQAVVWRDMLFRSPEASEDCLYLNVWKPADAAAGAKLPVLVYIHGGGLFAGDGSEPRYDGAAMARKGIVTVTINYRLGVFGFFTHQELAAESPSKCSGNYGFLDQVAALEWVKANIEAFGGDPARVCVAGESAGSISVCALMASPLARGLFSKAIGQSGAIIGTLTPETRERGEKAGADFVRRSGVADIKALRALSGQKVLELAMKTNGNRALTVIDGAFLKEEPMKTYAEGRQARVPLLAGWTSEEMGAGMLLGPEGPTLVNFNATLAQLYGEKAPRVAKVYRVYGDKDVLRAATELAGDRFIAHGTWKWLDAHARTGSKVAVYRYRFEQVPPAEVPAEWGADFQPSPPKTGAPHASDIPYFLGNLSMVKLWAYGDEHRRTEAATQAYAVNFIRTGNPNGKGLPYWPQLKPGKPAYLALGPEPREQEARDTEKYEMLDAVSRH